ncbi:MAG TPA: alpha/beta hydrolase [Alphaproteobacteria bacterium]|nr:alpha/beta hydrolase [Alphaproteobacteria bacterium]
MPLDPQCQAIVHAAAERGSVFDARTPDEARALLAASTAIFAPQAPALKKVEDRAIPGPSGDVPVRVYTPEADGVLPVLVYFHGGGWAFGDLESHDAMCRIIAHQAGCLVVAVDYRLAPEHKFPAGLEDCIAATRWCAEHGREIGGDPARLAVGGDSAGGNLAAAVAQAARNGGGPKLALQWLIYPAVDFTADNASLRENAEGFLLTKAAIDWTLKQYVTDASEARDPRASPGLASDLAGLPPALVQTAEFDPLRDEGEAYADALKAAGVPTETIRYDGMVHGFMRMGALVDRAAVGLNDGASALRKAFSG